METKEEDLLKRVADLEAQLEEAKRNQAKFAEEIAAKDAQVAEMKTELTEVEAKSIWQYFKEGSSLPVLQKGGTKTFGSENPIHASILELNGEYQFGLIEINVDMLSHTKRETSTMFSSSEPLTYSTEPDIQVHCEHVLSDMLHAMHLRKILSLRREFAISDIKPDFWLVTKNGFPVGVIEVKKPGKQAEDLRSPTNYGQLFDYMMRIRTFYGLSKVFGILTDFNQWQICWLPDSHDYAVAASVNLPVSSAVGDDADIVTARALHVSYMYTREDAKSLSEVLCSVLLKMNAIAASGVTPVPLLGANRCYIAMDEETWVWVPRISGVTELSFQLPAKQTKRYYLLRDFHGGADGKVWLTCNSSGSLAVVKLFPKSKVTKVTEEVSRWKECGFESVFGTTLSDRPAIIMPFGFHFTSTKNVDGIWWRGEPEGTSPPIEGFADAYARVKLFDAEIVLRKCIKRCADALLVHRDIEWRHVAAFPSVATSSTSSSSSTINFDFGFIDLSRMEPAESAEVATATMMASARANGMLL